MNGPFYKMIGDRNGSMEWGRAQAKQKKKTRGTRSLALKLYNKCVSYVYSVTTTTQVASLSCVLILFGDEMMIIFFFKAFFERTGILFCSFPLKKNISRRRKFFFEEHLGWMVVVWW